MSKVYTGLIVHMLNLVMSDECGLIKGDGIDNHCAGNAYLPPLTRPATRHFNPKVSATHGNKDQFEVLQLLSRTSSIEMVRRPGNFWM